MATSSTIGFLKLPFEPIKCTALERPIVALGSGYGFRSELPQRHLGLNFFCSVRAAHFGPTGSFADLLEQ